MHNYWLYVDQAGKYHPVVWDMNMSFGGFRFTGVDGMPLRNSEMQTLSPFLHYKDRNQKRPLITKLMRQNLFRKIYVAHIKTILNDYFLNGKYLERSKKIVALTDEDVKKDTNRLYTYEAFKQNLSQSAKAGKQSIIGIEELMAKRSEYLSNHSLIKKPQPVIDSIEHLDFDEELVVTAKMEGATKAWLYYRYEGFGIFKKIQMFDDSGHNDHAENDNIYGTAIPIQDKIEYYLVAENEATAILSPERASLEFYKYEKSVNE